MIIIDDIRVLAILVAVILLGFLGLAIFTQPKPQCPDGSTAQYIRSTWYCVAPPVKP